MAKSARTVKRKEDSLRARRGTSERHDVADTFEASLFPRGKPEFWNLHVRRAQNACCHALRAFDLDGYAATGRFLEPSLQRRKSPIAAFRRQIHYARLVASSPVLEVQDLPLRVSGKQALHAGELF